MTENAHLIDRRKFRRKLAYWPTSVLRKLPSGQLIYDQTVSNLTKEHKQTPPLYAGQAERGQSIQRNAFPLAESKALKLLEFWTIRCKNPDSNMRRTGMTIQQIQWINRFDWLDDLVVNAYENRQQSLMLEELDFKDNQANDPKDFCVAIVRNWITSHNHWSAISWHVPTLARRINNWLYFYTTFFNSATNISFDSAFFQSISKQLHHLRNSVMQETSGFDRIISLICWVNAGLCLSNEEKRLNEGVTLLSIELHEAFQRSNSELLASPRLCFETHHFLSRMSKGFSRSGLSVPAEIATAILRLEEILHQYRTPIGTLPCFHGTWDLPPRSIKLPKRSSKHKGVPPFAKPTLVNCGLDGFDITMDATSLHHTGKDQYRHLSPMAIEIFDGQQPLVINAAPPAEHVLQDAQLYRDNAYHSMPLLESPTLGTIRSDGTVAKGQINVKHDISAEDDSTRLFCRHNGYQKSLGASLERSIDLHLDEHGRGYICGYDSLQFNSEPRTDDTIRLISMFHLHPDLKTMPLAGGGVLVFKRKKADAWQFEPLIEGCSFHITQSLCSYHPHHQDGKEPIVLNTLWMAREIQQPELHGSYSNQWALIRVKK